MATIWHLCIVTFRRIYCPLSMAEYSQHSTIPNGENKSLETNTISLDWNRTATIPASTLQNWIEKNSPKSKMLRLRTTKRLSGMIDHKPIEYAAFANLLSFDAMRRPTLVKYWQCNSWWALAAQSFCFLILYRWRLSTIRLSMQISAIKQSTSVVVHIFHGNKFKFNKIMFSH